MYSCRYKPKNTVYIDGNTVCLTYSLYRMKVAGSKWHNFFPFWSSQLSLQIWGFQRRYFFLFLESIKNIYFSSRNLDLLLSSVELSGTLFRKKWKKNENPILEVWDQPQFPLAVFMPENPRNERFRSVSDQEKNPGTFFLPDGGEILDGSGIQLTGRSTVMQNLDLTMGSLLHNIVW